MSEKTTECNCTPDTKKSPVVIGSIIAYELAVIIVILIMIYFEGNSPCGWPCSCSCPQSKKTEQATD